MYIFFLKPHIYKALVAIPFSSTKPTSCKETLQESMLQTKWRGHHVRPRAVMNGPLKKIKTWILSCISDNKWCLKLRLNNSKIWDTYLFSFI